VKVLIDFAKKYASTDSEPEVLAAVTALTTIVKGTRTVLTKNGKATPRGVISELFVKVGDTATESDVFAKFRMGRGEMKGAIKLALKSAAPADREWILFNVEKEVYSLEAIGAEPPAGWVGYLPLDKATRKPPRPPKLALPSEPIGDRVSPDGGLFFAFALDNS